MRRYGNQARVIPKSKRGPNQQSAVTSIAFEHDYEHNAFMAAFLRMKKAEEFRAQHGPVILMGKADGLFCIWPRATAK